MKKLLNLDLKIHTRQKKVIFSFSVILISFVLFTIISCNKETELIKPNNQELLAQDAKQRVLDFKEMLQAQKNGSLNMRSTYTAEELIKNVESNINYTYGHAGLQYEEFEVETKIINVPELGGPMPPSVVTRVNDEVLDSVKCFYEKVVFSDKKLKFVDVFPVLGQNSIGINIVVGSFNSIFSGGNFSVGDNWKADIGKCDGSNLNTNAPERIGIYATWNIGVTHFEDGVWYDDPETVFYDENPSAAYWFAENPNDPNPGDWIIDYFQWKLDGCSEPFIPSDFDSDPCTGNELPNQIWDPMYGWIPNPAYADAFCIDYPEMNYYLANAETEALRHEPLLNKKFLHMSMGYSGSTYPQESYAQWWGRGTYAKRYIDKTRLVLELAPCN